MGRIRARSPRIKIDFSPAHQLDDFSASYSMPLMSITNYKQRYRSFLERLQKNTRSIMTVMFHDVNNPNPFNCRRDDLGPSNGRITFYTLETIALIQ